MSPKWNLKKSNLQCSIHSSAVRKVVLEKRSNAGFSESISLSSSGNSRSSSDNFNFLPPKSKRGNDKFHKTLLFTHGYCKA